MVIKDANYYTAQHDLKAITLVDQDYSSRQGKKTRAEVEADVLNPVEKELKKYLDLSFSKAK